MRFRRLISLALLTITVLAGCGKTVPGSVVHVMQPTATVDVSKLDPGRYPTAPLPPLGDADSEEAGRLAEGRRMAGHVVGPWQVDADLVDGGPVGPRIITASKQLGFVMWPAIVTPAVLQPLLVGFSSERRAESAKTSTSLRNIVLRFADDQAATVAARGMSAAAMEMPNAVEMDSPVPTEPIRSIPIPGHPDVEGALLTHVDGSATVQELTVISAHGPYVLAQVAQSADGPDHAAGFAGRALDLQVPLIDDFQSTDPAGFAGLPLDPTGLAARTLPMNGASNAVYDAAGALHLEENPVQAARAFADAGVDVVATGRTTVYRAADPEAAKQLAQTLADGIVRRTAAQPEAAVAGLPESRCVSQSGLITRTWCAGSADRYALKASTQQLGSAYREMAAQYLLLTG